MRAQLRTYHAIPSLQAQQDPHAYKQLQDAPRLKSILKGGMEDRPEPNALIKIKQKDVPRTNPVNLLFVICQSAFKIAELHFPAGQEFHDLLMKTQFSSTSRANAFLWLMWFYLESDFTEEGCDENPFGPGVDYGLNVANQGVPMLERMTKEEEEAENVDTQEEIDFGVEKKKLRHSILEVDQAFLNDRDTKRTSRGGRNTAEDGPAILPRIRPSKHESDMESTRSTPPPGKLGGRQGVMGSASRRGGTLRYQIVEGSSPAGPSQVDGIIARKPRPPTAHQLAVERHRQEQVHHILDRGLRKKHRKAKKLRRQEGAIYRAIKRIQVMPDSLAFDNSDDERDRSSMTGVRGHDEPLSIFRSPGPGGLAQLQAEEDDYGEEPHAYAAAVRRATRRLKRWSELEDKSVMPPFKRKRRHESHDGRDDENGMNGYADDHDDHKHADANGDITMEDVDDHDKSVTVLRLPDGMDDDDDHRQVSGEDASDID